MTRLGIMAGLLVTLAAAAASAQIPEGVEGAFEPHPEAEQAISEVYSPFCPGFMLEVCQASQSVAVRDTMQMLAYQGWTSEELVEWFLGNYGEQFRAVPEPQGWGIWAWFLPPIALVFGVAMVVMALRRFDPAKAKTAEAARAAGGTDRAAISEEEEARLRSAIREIELSEDPTF